jgi:hypothetical protein
MTTPSYITDHAAQALAKLAEQYKSKVKLAAQLGAFTAQTQAIEDALLGPSGLLPQVMLATATGAQLDLIGRFVGQPRTSFDDATYRLWLAARIQVNLSSGDVESIYSALKTLLAAGQTLQIASEGAASFALRIFGAPLTNASALAGVVAQAKVAGVRAVLEYETVAPAATFTWDGAAPQAWDTGAFADAL